MSMSSLSYAISWYPEIRGVLVVLIGVGVLMGSTYLLLSTNLGARLGLLVFLAALMGWMTIMGAVWWVYGIGLKGTEPSWKPVSVIEGDIESTPGVPEGASNLDDGKWVELPESDPGRGQAQSAADEILVQEAKLFEATTEYRSIAVYDKGGETWPRFINLMHRPHYALVEVKPVIQLPTEPGKPPPTAVIDESQDPVYVLMIRDLGHKRRPAALVTIGSGLLFAVFCSMLNSRDRLVDKNRNPVATGS